MIVTGRNVSVAAAAQEGRRRSLEVAITDCISRWGVQHPEQVVAIKKQTQFLRETAARGQGMSKLGHVMHQGQIPVTLHRMMMREIDRDWLNDSQARKIFWRLFKIGVVAKNSLMEDRW